MNGDNLSEFSVSADNYDLKYTCISVNNVNNDEWWWWIIYYWRMSETAWWSGVILWSIASLFLCSYSQYTGCRLGMHTYSNWVSWVSGHPNNLAAPYNNTFCIFIVFLSWSSAGFKLFKYIIPGGTVDTPNILNMSPNVAGLLRLCGSFAVVLQLTVF